MRLSKALARRGWISARIDFAGLGESAGDFAATTLETNISDLAAAAAYLEQAGFGLPRFLLGHSLGGVAVTRAAADLQRWPEFRQVTCIATYGAPWDPRRTSVVVPEVIDGLLDDPDPSRTVALPHRGVSLGFGFIDSLSRDNPAECMKNLVERGIDLLVAHSPFDQTVAFQQALAYRHAFLDAGGERVTLWPVEDADHLLAWPGAAQRVGDVCARWAAGASAAR